MSETVTRPKVKRLPLDEGAMEKIRTLVHDGWVDRLVVRDRDGEVVMQAPVVAGVAAAVVAPVWVALGALTGAALGCTLDVELRDLPAHDEWPFEPPPDVDEEPPLD